MPIEEIVRFPLLAECLEYWKAVSGEGLPQTIDPLQLPRGLIKGVSLVDWSDERGDWVLRLSSSLIDETHGRPMKGSTFADAFKPNALAEVHAQMRLLMERGAPDLARREFLDPKSRVWSFVRLFLPLSSNGIARDRYCLVMDPETFGKRIED
ncbi:MAG: PAS domain-containing protein [Alphaproteobacteria bacterium]|nr:PAS domain-containing protein [Alphaproteobacteria bacterium]